MDGGRESGRAHHLDDLARDALAGNPAALSDLLGRVRELALGHALARTRDPDAAEDVAQEVLIRVFTSLHTFRFQSRLESWVYRITRNEIQGHFRATATAGAAEERLRLREPASRLEPHAEAGLDADKILDTVRGAADALPQLQDRAFRLVVLQDLRPCEAARALGKSQANLRAALSRARTKVREALLEQAPELLAELGCSGVHRAA